MNIKFIIISLFLIMIYPGIVISITNHLGNFMHVFITSFVYLIVSFVLLYFVSGKEQ